MVENESKKKVPAAKKEVAATKKKVAARKKATPRHGKRVVTSIEKVINQLQAHVKTSSAVKASLSDHVKAALEALSAEKKSIMSSESGQKRASWATRESTRGQGRRIVREIAV